VARAINERDGEMETCPVCGDLCAIKVVKELFGGEKAKPAKKKGKR
jgi:phosphomethylpyrimidine synthase